MSKARVLIVEDENLVARDLHNMVRLLGYEVTAVVQTGEEVIASLNQKKPDLVLMDIVLKGKLDGISVAAVVWEEYCIPVVYITSFADDLTFERAKLTEPFGYLIKPFEERAGADHRDRALQSQNAAAAERKRTMAVNHSQKHRRRDNSS